MQKIGDITPTADANGEWTNGNVAGGTPPTIMDAAWFNTMQRELINVLNSAGLMPDPENDTQLLAAMKLIVGAGRLLGTKVITSSGTYIPTPGTKKIIVEVQGGGGGGGGAAIAASGSAIASVGAGGTAGCYVKSIITSPASSYPVVIGAGGAGGGAGLSGAGGGLTRFGSEISAGGGYGGLSMTSGSTAALLVSDSSTQPSGSLPIGANISSSLATSQYNSAVRLSGSVAQSGAGGHSAFGNGGGGTVVSNISGADSNSYGGGGGGARASGTIALSLAGGAGGNGIVTVMEFS